MPETVGLRLSLEKRAAKGGGDKYSGAIPGTNPPMPFSIYVPQMISRAGGEAKAIAAITITMED